MTFSCVANTTKGTWSDCREASTASLCDLARRSLDVVAVTVDGHSPQRFDWHGGELTSDVTTGVVSFSANPFEDVRVSVTEIEPNVTLAISNFEGPATPLLVGSEFSLPAALVLNGEGQYEWLEVRRHYAPHDGAPWPLPTVTR